VADYIGISDTTPKWIPTNLPIIKEDPLYERDHNLCIGCTRCVRACRDLRGIEALGFVHGNNRQIQIGTLGPTLDESGCKYCTACVEVCPTGALMDKEVRPGKREEDLVPCREACPAHIDIPGYLRMIADGKAGEAYAVIREKVPFAGILGRICIHPCEEVCRRGEVNDPVAICALKRFAADRDTGVWKEKNRINDDTGKRVAVVGAGPAGLTSAFYLHKQGHRVIVFEAKNQAGGMMRYAIPDYRLPSQILDKEVQEILDLGIEFRPLQALGKDFTMAQLKENGYDAVFLGVGAQVSRRISIEGHDLPDVLWGIDFLKQVAEEEYRCKDRIIVIGGGNVAVDVALSALRCGAKEVTMACLESREEMPAHEWEIQCVLEEGVTLMPSWGPHRILSHDGHVIGVKLVRCTSVFNDQGNFSPVFDTAKESIEGDQVIMAIGQVSDLSFLGDESLISVDKGLIVVDQESLETGFKGVYAGGDVVTVPGSIISAIAAGRKAASSIDKALGGTGDIEEILLQRETPGQYLGRDEGFAQWMCEKVPKLGVELRHQDFQEVSLGYEEEQAVSEAKRCLQCDLRLTMDRNPSPPEKWFPFDEEHISQIPETEGVYQLLDEDHNVLGIKGTANMRESLGEELEVSEKAALFEYEEDKMYSKRESELIQQYLQEHGEMPGGGDSDLDDLY
jgi:NADPH-dependent glutamate synthase beta subunit-like oxidoreductase/Pyruvate/2-oxoacid:ferredoxin oxidoreductase delta subunit